MTKPAAARVRVTRRRRSILTALLALFAFATVLASVASAQLPSTTDPRATLAAGTITPVPGGAGVPTGAGVAALGMQHLALAPKPATWFNPLAPNNPGDFGFVNSDLALQGSHAFVGNFNGFSIYDISNPASPTLRTAVVCPGGQGEVSVYGNLLFMSAEETRARTDCGAPAVPIGDPLRFRGVRIFDISNLDAPVQVAAVQTCRGSHTHTLLKSPHDDANIYVYVNGTGSVRSTTEMASCKALPSGTNVATPHFDEGLSQFRIEVIRVPLSAPQDAAVVNGPRLFKNEATGQLNGLQNGPTTPLHPSGIGWSPSPSTDSCHDITTFPEIDLAAGSCEGNGLLLDISDPANPVRIDAVADPLFAYWHGATFSNDGTKVIFTDEWGGGTAARCRATDQLSWGADAIYEIVDRKLVFKSYYKLPVAQTTAENCVSHLPSLIPVPGRDIMVQAWYQGGASVIDFTDAANPREIAYFDRGPLGASLILGGLWSTYYYNGAIYGSEIARGFDVWQLTPTDQLSANEIEAASEVELARLTPQHQPRFVNAPSFAVARSYLDQLLRVTAVDAEKLKDIERYLDTAEDLSERRGLDARAARTLRDLSRKLAGDEFAAFHKAVLELAAALED